jgi:ribose transport system substrate-binding protein
LAPELFTLLYLYKKEVPVMKAIKKIILFGLTMVMIISVFAGCAAPTGDVQNNDERAEINVEDLVIGVSMYTLGAPYFVAQLNSIKRYGEELGFDVISADAGDDMTKQLSDVEDLLARGIDLLILNPKDPIGLVPATKAATAAGVPVVIIDSSIDMTADFISIVQSNNMANGELVGEWLGEAMAGEPLRIALISGSKGNPVGKERRQGVFRGLTEYMLRTKNAVTGFEIVAQGWGNWAHEGGLHAMEDILVAHPDINVLLTENDSMALGALRAIQEAGKEGQILVVAAADGQKEALELIKTGEYGATGLNNPALVARTGVDVGIRYLQGETNIPKITYTPPAVITRENVDQFYDPNADF